MDEESLNTAINLVRSGQRQAARSLLARLLRDDPSDESAWMWLVETMDNDAQRAEALRQCLAANPGSEAARNALKRLRVPAASPLQNGGLSASPGSFMETIREPSTPTPPAVSPPQPDGKKPKRPGFMKRLLKGCLVIVTILVVLGLLGAAGYYAYLFLSSQPTPAPTAIPITVIIPTETRATRFVLQPTSTYTLVPSPTSPSTPTYRPAPNFDPNWKIAWTVKGGGLYSLSSVGIPKLEIPGYPYASYPPPASRIEVSGQTAWVHPADGGPRIVLVDDTSWAAATVGWDAIMGSATPLPSRSAVVLEAIESTVEGDPRILGFVIVNGISGEVLFVLQIEPIQGDVFYSPDGHYAAILSPASITLVDFVSGEIQSNIIVYEGGMNQTGAGSNSGGIYWLDNGDEFIAAIPSTLTGNSHHLYKVEASTASAYRLMDLPADWDMGPLYIHKDASTLVLKDLQGNLYLFNPQDAGQTPLAGIGDVVSSAGDGRHFLLWTGKEFWVSQVDGEPYRLGLPGMQLEKPAWLGNLDLVFLVKEDTRYSLYYQGMDNPPQRLVAGLGTDLEEIGLFTWPEGERFPWEVPDTLSTPRPAPSISPQPAEGTAFPGLTVTPGPPAELQPIPGLTPQTVLNSLWKKGFNCLSTADPTTSSSQRYHCLWYGDSDYLIEAEIILSQDGVASIKESITPEASSDQDLNEAAIPTALDHFSLITSLPYQGAEPETALNWLENNISAVVKDNKSLERELDPVIFRLSGKAALEFEMSAIPVNE